MNGDLGFRLVLIIGFLLTAESFAADVAPRAPRPVDSSRQSVTSGVQTGSTGARPRRRGAALGLSAAPASDMAARADLKGQARETSGATSGSVLGGVPANDFCASAELISGEGAFAYDNSLATLDGPSHAACIDIVDPVGTMIHDIWYCWTATCTGAVEVTSCGEPLLDTKFAVYGSCENAGGSPNCPPGNNDLFPFGCNDDDPACAVALQSTVTFLADAGESYLLRIGTYPGNGEGGTIPPAPGGASSFRVTCVDLPCSEDTSSDHCQNFDRLAGTVSDRVDFRAADDFTPTESGVITDLCWWGQYWFNFFDPIQFPDEFEIRYFADDAGLPGELIGGPFVQADGTLSVSLPADTAEGLGGPNGFKVFEYTGTHGGTCSASGSSCDVWAQDCPDVCAQAQTECQSDADCTDADDFCTVPQDCQAIGVPVTAGECYWIEITNDSGNNFWFWEDGLGGNVSSLLDGADRCSISGAHCDFDDDCRGICALSQEECVADRDCDRPGDTCTVAQTCNPIPLDGYDAGDTASYDLSFCVNVSQRTCGSTPCDGATGQCCEGSPNGTPGCDDFDCCAKVCACDPFCCGDSGWDEFCQGSGFGGNGCGAAVMCADLCAGCPDGTVAFLDPLVDPIQNPDGLVDARQPWPIGDPATLQGFQTFFIEAPMDAGTATVGGCWTLCETGDTGSPNAIESIVSHGNGTFTLTLERPITFGELTTLTYTSDTGVSVTERFAALSGDANSDRLVTAGDINHLINCINLVTPVACDEWQTDINRSGVTNGQDILRLIDLLNGADTYDVWITQTVPVDCVNP